jgi:predicted small lipoprotein YifL
MKAFKATVVAFIAISALSACGKKGDVESADTTTVPGVDTTAGMAMPTTDTVVKTTVTDTIQGEVPRDSVKGKKPATKTP